MLPVTSSSHKHPKDPSPKAEVHTSERTVSFRKSSSSSLGVQGKYEEETEKENREAYERLLSSSEESSNSGGSISINDSIEYRRLSSGNNSPKEDSSSHVESRPETPPYRRMSSDNDSPEEGSPSHVVNIPEMPPCAVKSLNTNTEIPQQKVDLSNPQQQALWSRCFEFYRNLSRKIIYSWILLPLYTVFFIYAAQAAYMGAVYSNKCPFFRDGTSMFFLMGCSGLGASSFQLLSLIQKSCFPNGCLSTTHMISFLFSVFYLGTYCIELHRFMSVEGMPTNVPGPYYCDSYFFGYVCWSNFSFLIVTALLVIILVPPFFINVFCNGKS